MTTLSDAEPGDTAIVAVRLTEKDEGHWWGKVTQDNGLEQWVLVNPSIVRSIEKAPKPLKVGDMVKHIKGWSAPILCIDGEWAWLNPHGIPGTYRLANLTVFNSARYHNG